MVIILERTIRDDDKQRIRSFLEERGLKVREIVGVEETILGAVGRVSIDHREVEILPGVERVIPISKPFKLASRELQKEDSIVTVGPVKIGGHRITMIAGPCSVESREQVLETAALVRRSGAVILRGGAFKPRTSPYSFQGLGEEGLRYLKEAGEQTGMPVASEVVSPTHVELMRDYVDVYQIGARNMQNFELLKAVGSQGMPVLLKRGIAATIEEWLMAAEYLLAHGTDRVILCERGIRTFETYTRFTLDVSAIPVVRKLCHLPIIVDPSHAVGIRDKVSPVALGSVAAGADGLIVEVHPRPEQALSDGPQALYPAQFEKLMRDIEALAPVVEKELSRLPELNETRPSLAGVVREVAEADELAVAFQGERGAYSELAVKRYFQSDSIIPRPLPAFRDVFDAVLEGKVRYGLVPLENSLAGSIHENYDLFLQYPDIRIAGETQIRVVHTLIGLPGASLDGIKRVLSHPQGLAQCGRFLDDHPGWERVPFYDTAGAVAHIAQQGDPANAAIASSEAARVYKMEVLREGIETNPQNYTRFVVLAREEASLIAAPNKASIVFSTPDTPGALFECLKVLAERKVNMKKIESRPIPGKPWRYMFYLDVEMPAEESEFRATMDELSTRTEDLMILGKYRV
ncbi:3-deoxy-7-phosphoheptulonate synthase [Salinispira pacifica]